LSSNESVKAPFSIQLAVAVQLFDYFQANMSATGHSGWSSKEAGCCGGHL